MTLALYSQAQIAKMLGISRQALAKKMADCPASCVGDRGLRFYSLDALPEPIQAKVLAASSEHLPSTSEQMTPASSEQTAATSEHLAVDAPEPSIKAQLSTPSARPRKAALPPPDSKALQFLDAWQEILTIRQEWGIAKDCKQIRQCDKDFAAAVMAGQLPEVTALLPLIAWGKHPGLSHGSIDRYRRKFQQQGITGFIRRTAKTAQAKIDSNPELVRDILGFLVAHPAATLTRCYKEISKIHGDFASLSAMRNWERRWKRDNQSTWLYLTDRDKWNNTYKVAFGTHDDTEYPNHIWELDSTPADIALPDGRHCALGLIDIYTRRAKVLVNKSSTAAAVLSLLRQTMIEWGLPTTIRTDNGSDYVSKAVKRFCAQMEIHHDICTPGTPQAKPYIERFFGTYSHDVMPILPGYLGHNVEIVTKLRGGQKGKPIKIVLDADRFQQWTNEWLTEYHSRPHSGINKSPDQALADALAQGWQPRQVESLRELDMLLNVVGLKKVQKAGIRHEGHFYIEGGLVVGSHVWAAIDPAEMGRLYWFNQSGEYGGEAIAGELLGIDRREVALEADRKQKADIKEGKAKIRKAKSSKRPYVAATLAETLDSSRPGTDLAIEPEATKLPSNVVPIRKAEKAPKPFDKEGIDAPFFSFAAPWLAGELEAAINGWPDQDRMGNIAARSSHKKYWGSVAPLLREEGITAENAPEYFAEIHRIASQLINLEAQA
jgi:transposase InsO family protein